MEESDYYFGNPNLARAGTKHEYTQEQILEFKRCIDDIAYFVKTYMKIINVDQGLMLFNLFPYQERFLRDIQSHRNVIALMSRQ